MQLTKERQIKQLAISNTLSKSDSRKRFNRKTKQIQFCNPIFTSRTFDSSSPSKIDDQDRTYKLAKFQGLLQKLSKIISKRKCVAFYKIMRQFGSFSSQSSLLTVQGYNQVLGADEAAHTIYKIFQTKLSQQKMWGLYNLRFHTFLKKAYQGFSNVNNILSKKKNELKKEAFRNILVYSVKVAPVDETNIASRYISSNKEAYPRSSALFSEREILQVHHHHYVHHDQCQAKKFNFQSQMINHNHCQLHCKNRESQFISNKCNSCKGFLSQKKIQELNEKNQDGSYSLEQRVAYLNKLKQIAAQYTKSMNQITRTSFQQN